MATTREANPVHATRTPAVPRAILASGAARPGTVPATAMPIRPTPAHPASMVVGEDGYVRGSAGGSAASCRRRGPVRPHDRRPTAPRPPAHAKVSTPDATPSALQ